jgi:hypothetical protein
MSASQARQRSTGGALGEGGSEAALHGFGGNKTITCLSYR